MPHKILVMLVASFSLQALAAEMIPPDVRAFIDDREGCDHMRGELHDPSDKERMRREIENLCKGTDRRLAKLKRKHASNRTVMRHLNQFETHIEPNSDHARR